MAGDWLKIEEDLPDKPEVFAIAAELNIDPDSVTGKLIRVWRWASHACHSDGVTIASAKHAIDKAAGTEGFACAMLKAGWLVDKGESIQFPKFNRHNSKTAKERGLAFIRKQRERGKNGHDSVTPPSRKKRDKNVTKDAETNADLNAETEAQSAAPPDDNFSEGSPPQSRSRRSRRLIREDFLSPERGHEEFQQRRMDGKLGPNDELRFMTLWYAASTKANPAAWFTTAIEAAVERREWWGDQESEDKARIELRMRNRSPPDKPSPEVAALEEVFAPDGADADEF